MENRIENYIRKAKSYARLMLQDKSRDLNLDKKEKDALDSIDSGEYASWRTEKIKAYSQEENWKRVESELKIHKKPKGRVRFMKTWRSIAAIIVIGLIGAEGYLIYKDMQSSYPEMISPGKSMAYLEVNGSQRINLAVNDTLLMFKEAVVQIDSGRISYSAGEGKEKHNEYHKINVPRNGEFYVKLSDGTKVWVNSESKIGFKSKFNEKSRVVDLEGEAYFEVAKDATRPFIVKTSKMDVRVLGTHFNIKAYPNDDLAYTTLNEGSVRVNLEDESSMLKPNEQLVLDKRTGKYIQKEVDASIYSAWVKGQFIFKDESLENIMQTFSRWYDVEIFFLNQTIKHETFSMSVNRYDNIEVLLKKMEKTGAVSFELNKNALIVK